MEGTDLQKEVNSDCKVAIAVGLDFWGGKQFLRRE